MRYFDWDPAKARANIKKHNTDFETASQVFLDPFAVRRFDRRIGDEIRWHTLGIVQGRMLLLVVHTMEDENGDEYIRIISARRATPREEKIYFATNREEGHV